MAAASIVGFRAPRLLEGNWEIAAVQPGMAVQPADLDRVRPEWIACDGAVTVAAALRTAGRWSFDRPRDFDAEDWWYRCRFSSPAIEAPVRLRFAGLATVADVWLNGEHILHSESMFVAHSVDIARLIRDGNELVLKFHALAPLLAARTGRPRPKWRTSLIEHQALRWYRTSLLGRMPAWCPPVAPVGPWRPILIETSPIERRQSHVIAELDGDAGSIRMQIRAKCPSGTGRGKSSADIQGSLAVGDYSVPITCDRLSENEYALTGVVRLPRVERWWPHTHGPQPLYNVCVSLTGDYQETIDLGRVGFRSLDVDRGHDGNGFGFIVNDAPVFARGVCWTPLDLASLSASAADYRVALAQLRAAGVNMVRVGGTMTYESTCFHDLCDELGILVWQDLMFASMDYPWQDVSFANTVRLEAAQTLEALQARPSLAVVCGSSEIDQQAAMLGLPGPRWSGSGCDALLTEIVQALAPAVVWLPTTPTGGTFPFHVDTGISHYYGVGAYRRPFDDARRANVRFAAECLGFSNVPDDDTIALVLTGGGTPNEDPRWKAHVPRDGGASWDFEDVRDHYVELLFGVHASELRRRDAERYLALGRVATGEAMLRTFAEWRRPGSSCRGGLVWFARDLSPGAGWGVIDSTGRPKAAYWYLKRALAPIALLSTDEGLNGLWLHAMNDSPEPVDADLRVALYLDGTLRGEPAHTMLSIPARSCRSVHADDLFSGFRDLTYAYRFGPPGHDVVRSTLRDRATGSLLAASCHFPGLLLASRTTDVGLAARVQPTPDGYSLLLETARFAHAVAVDIDGFLPDDNYVSLEPGETKRIVLRSIVPGAIPRGTAAALNGIGAVPVVVEEAVNAG